MDRADIFASLRSFDHEGLDAAGFEARALELLSGDVSSADELHRRFLDREPLPLDPECSDDDLRVARNGLENIFEFHGEQHPVGDDIDWDHNPGTDHWVHDLNRFAYLDVLLKASAAADDDRYAAKAAELVLDWVRKNPVTRSWFWTPDVKMSDVGNGAWRSYLNIAIHVRRWADRIEPLARFWAPIDLLHVLKSIHDQLGYLEQVIPTMTNNWVIIGANGMLTTALRLPELRDRDRFIAYAWEKMEAEAERQVLPDGVQFELTPGYHHVVARLLCNSMARCRDAGVDPPASIEPVTARMLDYQMQTITPDDRLLAFNNTDPGSAPGIRTLLTAEGRRRGRSDWLYVGTRGAEGAPPEVLSQAFEYGGVYVMRTGWAPDSTYLAFDGGPWGYSHQHDDRLGFWLSAFGRPLLIDPGRYLYDARNPYSRRNYLNTTRAHSTITVDGEDQADRYFRDTWEPKEKLTDNRWLVTDSFQRAAASHSLGYGENGRVRAVHRRSITFWPPDVFLVLDRVTGPGEHRVRSRLQFPPGRIDNLRDLWHTTSPDANVAVLPMMDTPFDTFVEKGEFNPTAGWYSERVNQIEPSPTLNVHAKTDLPLRAGFLIVPFRGEILPSMALVFHGDTVWFSVSRVRREVSFDEALA
jgi:hypothetical protein